MDTHPGAQHFKTSRTRAAVRATPSQLMELKNVFQETTRPTKRVKDSLAERTNLTPDWINSWFMRQRKKGRSIRYRPEHSPPAAMGQPPGVSHPYPFIGSLSNTLEATTAAAAAAISPSNGRNTWPAHCSSHSAVPVLSLSIGTAHPVASLPDPYRSHMDMHDAPINNTNVCNALLPSHAAIATTSQPTVSSASSPGFGNLSDGSHYSSQFSACVPHLRQNMLSSAPLVSPIARQPQSFYAPVSFSGPITTDAPGRRSLFECQLEPQPENRLLSGMNPREAYSTLETWHTGELSMGVSNRKDCCVEQREDPVEGHGGDPHFGTNSPARSLPNDNLSITHHRTEGVATETGTDTLQTEGSGYSTPETETAISPVYEGETETDLGNNDEADLERSMSEAEAWKKARAHPDFETFLKIAGVHGNFELTDNGLVFRSDDAVSPSRLTG